MNSKEWARASCGVLACGKATYRQGWCCAHYQKVKRYGEPIAGRTRKPDGAGSVDARGYTKHTESGVRMTDHTRVAEKALGKPLPTGAVIHHVDDDPSNNEPGNLVICPSHAYHMLIHQRARAFDACGHADWRKCTYCKGYDDPKNLQIFAGGRAAYHAECRSKYRADLLNSKRAGAIA